jgi:chromosome segregation ATPase
MTSPGTAVVQDKTQERSLVEKLRIAEAVLAEAKRIKRVTDEGIESAVRGIETNTRELNAVAGTLEDRTDRYQDKRKAVRELDQRLEKLRADSRIAEKKLADSQVLVARVRCQIDQHPIYATAIAEQRKIIGEGVRAAEQMWSGPLSNMSAAVKRFEEIADRELLFERATNVRLRDAGLPELKAQLWNCRTALPSVIINMPLMQMKRDCDAALTRILSY